MTRHERERRGRRILAAGIAVSGTVHAAALFLIVIPGGSLDGPDHEIALAPPAALQVVALAEQLPLPAEPLPPQMVQTQASAAADAGGGAAAAPVQTAPSPEPSVASAPLATGGMVAALDSLFHVSVVPVVQVAMATGQESAAPAPDAQVSGTAAAPRHVPGSAARAKGGLRSGDGVDASLGDRGITIRVGPKRHGPKRHPPRGIPGRRW